MPSLPGIGGDDHSSRPGIARGLQRPTRWPRTGRPSSRNVLRRSSLRHPIWSCSVRGFACHRRYRRRGALLPHLFTLTSVARGGIFSVPLVRQVTLPGRYPAHCPSEFGLSSPPGTTREPRLPEAAIV